MRSYWSRVCLKYSMTGVLIRGGEDARNRHWEERRVASQRWSGAAATKDAKDCWQPPEAREGIEQILP